MKILKKVEIRSQWCEKKLPLVTVWSVNIADLLKVARLKWPGGVMAHWSAWEPTRAPTHSSVGDLKTCALT